MSDPAPKAEHHWRPFVGLGLAVAASVLPVWLTYQFSYNYDYWFGGYGFFLDPSAVTALNNAAVFPAARGDDARTGLHTQPDGVAPLQDGFTVGQAGEHRRPCRCCGGGRSSGRAHGVRVGCRVRCRVGCRVGCADLGSVMPPTSLPFLNRPTPCRH